MLIPSYMVVEVPSGKATLYRNEVEAWDAARCLAGPDRLYVVDGLSHDTHVAANPAIGAQRAMELSTLPMLDTGEVMRIPLERAFSTIRRYLPKSKDQQHLGTFLGADSGGGLLRENAKLVKALKSKKLRSTQVGLQLVPEKSAFVGYGAGNSEKRLPWRRLPTFPHSPKSTLCAGSTEACRSACLQFSGQNVSPEAVASKQRTTLALLEHPLEFARLLVEACRRFVANATKAKKGRHARPSLYPYIRLNVLSDIPWELFFPGLFELVKGRKRKGAEHLFYDYTKLAGRGPNTPENYHITFSFSGKNMATCHRELAQGTNVTVPFLHVRRDDGGRIVPVGRRGREEKWFLGTPRESYRLQLPEVWEGPNGLGRPVIDGDKNDLRPLDEPGRWVGLRYKAAAGIQDETLLERVGTFVVCCWEDEATGLFVAAETPGQTNVDTGA